MERDFLGLNCDDSAVLVEEEAIEGCDQDSGSEVQRPSSNKVSALPHFISFEGAEEEKMAKVVSDAVASARFMAISTADAFDATHKRLSVELQKLAGTTVKQQLLGGIPVTVPHSVLPSLGSVEGTMEPWFTSKSSGVPTQLTIFYGGMVKVYDDISPAKAQAIMFLAGNASSTPYNMGQPKAQVQVPASKQAGGDDVLVNQPTNASPCSVLSSPMSVSSHPVGQCGGGGSSDEVMAVNPTRVSSTLVSKVDLPNMVTLLGPLAATTIISSAVPQARKASLARFLEKRKERAMNSAPYNVSKKSPECATLGSNDATHSAGAGAGSVSTTKEIGHDV